MRSAIVVAVVVCVLTLAGAAFAGDAARTFSIDWQGEPLADALSTLKKHHGMNYVLPAELGSLLVTASVWQATPERALQTAVNKAGLTAEDRNGTWYISMPKQKEAKGGATFAQFPGMGGMMPGMGGGMPGLAGGGPNPSGMGGGGLPSPTGGFGTRPPGAGGLQTAAQQQQQQQQRPMHFLVIPINRANPEIIGQAFQADDVIYDYPSQGGGSGGYGGGGSSGGYGRSGSSGSSGYGNNNSSSSRSSSSRSSSSRSSSSRSGSSRNSGYN